MANEEVGPIRPVDALQALNRMTRGTSKDHGADATTIAQFIAERTHATAPPENTGLPCVYCGEKQKTLSIQREDDGVHIRVSTCATSKDIAGLRKILRSFEDK